MTAVATLIARDKRQGGSSTYEAWALPFQLMATSQPKASELVVVQSNLSSRTYSKLVRQCVNVVSA